MKELLYSPPALIIYSMITMLFLYFSLPNLNLIHFPFNLIGLVVSLLGLILMGKSKKLFKKYKTPLKLEKSTFLITESVFSKTRNPIYVGMTTLILGLSIFSTNIIALFVPLAFFLLVSHLYIKKEEILMKDAFGEEYLNYKKSVRRWV